MRGIVDVCANSHSCGQIRLLLYFPTQRKKKGRAILSSRCVLMSSITIYGMTLLVDLDTVSKL